MKQELVAWSSTEEPERAALLSVVNHSTITLHYSLLQTITTGRKHRKDERRRHEKFSADVAKKTDFLGCSKQ